MMVGQPGTVLSCLRQLARGLHLADRDLASRPVLKSPDDFAVGTYDSAGPLAGSFSSINGGSTVAFDQALWTQGGAEQSQASKTGIDRGCPALRSRGR